MGSMGLIFTPLLVRSLLGPLGFPGPMTALLGLMDTPKSPIKRYNAPSAAHPLMKSVIRQ